MKRALILLLWLEILILLIVHASFVIYYCLGGGRFHLLDDLSAAVSTAAGLICIPLLMLNTLLALRFLFVMLQRPSEYHFGSCWIEILNLIIVIVVGLIIFATFSSSTTPQFVYDLW
jgi:hypothetical protein